MPLVKCLNCSADISDRAETCPKCQCNVKVFKQQLEYAQHLLWEAQGLYDNKKLTKTLTVLSKAQGKAVTAEISQLSTKVLSALKDQADSLTDNDTAVIIEILTFIDDKSNKLHDDPQIIDIRGVCANKLAEIYIVQAQKALANKDTDRVSELIAKCHRLGYKSDVLAEFDRSNKIILQKKSSRRLTITISITIVVLLVIAVAIYYA